MRYLGLDLGTKTLGIAISDKGGIISTSLKTIRFEFEDYDSVLPELKEIIDSNEIDVIVIGLPKNMNGTIGFAGERTINFCEKMKTITDKKIVMEDERLTSVSANNLLIKADISRKKRKNIVDKMAANIILQQYLDKVNRGNYGE